MTPETRKDPGPVETAKVTFLDVLLLRGVLAESVQCLPFVWEVTKDDTVSTPEHRSPGEGTRENHVNATPTQELQGGEKKEFN